MPAPCDSRLLGAARYEERLGAAVPGTQDMIAHLVVHAACAHLLNVGPGALIDLDLWCARKSVEWPAFWDRAQAEGHARPAALMFVLVERWRRPDFLKETLCPLDVADTLLDESEALLVQNLDARKDVYALSSLGRGSVRDKLAQQTLDHAEHTASPMGRIGQLARRSTSLLYSVLRRETRHAARSTAHVRDWLSD